MSSKMRNSALTVIVTIVLIILIILVILSHRKPKQNQKRSERKSRRPLESSDTRLSVRSANNPSNNYQQDKFYAEATCPAASGITSANLTLANPCYTFTCDQLVNIQSISINKVLLEDPTTLISPLDDLPILSPGTDTTCPDDGTLINDDPLISSIIKKDIVFQHSWLIFTNADDNLLVPSPAASSGPWYFEKEPYSTSNKTVITCGCRETFDPTSNRNDEKHPPHQSNTNSRLDLTFDASLLDPAVTKVLLDVTSGFSSELNYDYYTIYVNGSSVFKSSGPGASITDPYRHDNRQLLIPINATVRFEYLRDPSAYGGVDSVYFTINKAVPIKDVAFPTTLHLTRGADLIKDYGPLTDLDGDAASITIDCTIQILTGDKLCLVADSGTYAQYDVTANYQDIPQIYEHRFEENFIAPLDANTIEYNNRRPKERKRIGGWYNTNDTFFRTQIYIEEVSGCPEGSLSKLALYWYSSPSSGAYYLNGFWGGAVSPATAPAQYFIEIARNVFKEDNLNGPTWLFDEITGEFRVDTSDSKNIAVASMNTMIPIINPDERYWELPLKLQDPNAEFNTPFNYFDYLVNFYKCGRISSMFGQRSFPTWDPIAHPEMNLLQLDQTQVKGSFGVTTKARYDDLARRLVTRGIVRKYRIQRWIYYPDPVASGAPSIPQADKIALSWVVNQNRYGYLAFTTKLNDEGEDNWPRLCPGETVTLKGTGTRLSGYPLRLCMDGYHTGPKPDSRFMQTYSGVDPRNGKTIPDNRSYDVQKEWAYYTLRLPLTIDSTNNTIYSRNGGFGLDYTPGNGNMSITVNSTPPAALGPYNSSPTQSGMSPVHNASNSLSGNLILANPLNAVTLTTNVFNTAIDSGVMPASFDLKDITVLTVYDTTGFPSAGTISVETDNGPVDITYTGKTATDFTGVVGSGPTGGDYFVCLIVDLPQSVIPVVDTTGFASSGSLLVYSTDAGGQIINYTGKTATSFTGVTGGTGRIFTGDTGLSFPYYSGFSVPLTNAVAINGNIALIKRGGANHSRKVWTAYLSGAIGVVEYNNAATNVIPALFQGTTGFAPIGNAVLSGNDGNALEAALLSGKLLQINIGLTGPIFKTTLPSGTWYLGDLLQQMFDDYLAGKTEFYMELGNLLVPPPADPLSNTNVGNPYGWNDLFVLGGTTQSLLFGPADNRYPSNFFGTTGLNIAYLWGVTPNVPLLNTFQGISNDYADGSYAQLSVGQYRTHTPLTAKECRCLLKSLTGDGRDYSDDEEDVNPEDYNDKPTGPIVRTKHGPIRDDMTYANYAACVNELSMASSTEDHTMWSPWVYKCEGGMYELPINMQTFLARLRNVVVDPTYGYTAPGSDLGGLPDVTVPGSVVAPFPGIPLAATWAPYVYCMSIRATGVGHPGEFSEMYNAGYARISLENQSRGESRLEWITPKRTDRFDIFTYKPNTIMPNLGGDISLRSVDIPVVNYLEEAFWLGTRKVASGPYTGAPDYFGIPYNQHTNSEEYQYSLFDYGTGKKIRNKQAVPGDWLYGYLKDSKARSILGLASNVPVPDRVGYLTWYTSDFGQEGDSDLLPFKDVSNLGGAIVAVARILQYFNQNNVKHIIIDVRNTVGGSEPFWNAFASLVGGNRFFGLTEIQPIGSIEANGVTAIGNSADVTAFKESTGEVTYDGRSSDLECSPQAYLDFGLADLVGSSPSPVWNGEVTGQAALGKKSNIIWFSNATTISNTQYKCLFMKGTSINQSEYDGDFGKSTQFIEYGVYYRPFSTSGNYDSHLQWWTRGRVGEEINPVALTMCTSRWEASRAAYMQDNVQGKGGVLKGLDQEFSNLQRPHIKWDMNANVLFEDIGYTIGNPGVNVATDGEPLLPARYSGVNLDDPLTFRDSVLERAVQMVNDDNVLTHFYQEDGYGYVSKLL